MGPSYYWRDEDLVFDTQPEIETELISFRPIGHVEVVEEGGGHTPNEGRRESRIVLDPILASGLDGLQAGDRLTVVFHFDRSHRGPLLQHPRGDPSRPKRGVFALRSPRRPNRIGITVVEILAIEGNVIRVRGLDAFDGTPVLDLKPTPREAA